MARGRHGSPGLRATTPTAAAHRLFECRRRALERHVRVQGLPQNNNMYPSPSPSPIVIIKKNPATICVRREGLTSDLSENRSLRNLVVGYTIKYVCYTRLWRKSPCVSPVFVSLESPFVVSRDFIKIYVYANRLSINKKIKKPCLQRKVYENEYCSYFRTEFASECVSRRGQTASFQKTSSNRITRERISSRTRVENAHYIMALWPDVGQQPCKKENNYDVITKTCIAMGAPNAGNSNTFMRNEYRAFFFPILSSDGFPDGVRSRWKTSAYTKRGEEIIILHRNDCKGLRRAGVCA